MLAYIYDLSWKDRSFELIITILQNKLDLYKYVIDNMLEAEEEEEKKEDGEEEKGKKKMRGKNTC